ncbi:MAG TPA: hypothetical protein VGK20_04030 [Candidatus Binatia bacterium]|jgi:hypothetical protein
MHEPTDETRRVVEEASGLGLPQAQVGLLIGVSEKTLRLHYREELDRGMAVANAAVARSLFRAATADGNVTAMIFWCKTRLRWAPPPREELVRLSTEPPAPTWAQIAPSLAALAGSSDPQALADVMLKLRRLDRLEHEGGCDAEEG